MKQKKQVPGAGKERFCKEELRYVCNQKVNGFVEALLRLEKEHGFCVAHEDVHGAFVIVPYSEVGARWMAAAHMSDERI